MEQETSTLVLQKGEELRAQQKWQEAIRAYSSVLSSQEIADKTLFAKAYCYDQLKDYGKAAEEYNKAIDLNHNNPSYYNRGIAYKNSGKYQKAIDDYTMAISLNKNHSDYYYNRAIAYKHLGRL